MRWITSGKTEDRPPHLSLLIKPFIDPEPTFIYIPFQDVLEQARQLDAILIYPEWSILSMLMNVLSTISYWIYVNK